MKHFSDIHTIEELKKEYRKLALKYHPDNAQTGNIEMMQEINNEYEFLFKKLQNSDKKANKNEASSDFIEIINRLMALKGIVIEIVGSWLWVTGNTFSNKDILKEIGFMYSKSKKSWYYFKDIDGKKHRSSYQSMDNIRIKYGSQKMESAGKYDNFALN